MSFHNITNLDDPSIHPDSQTKQKILFPFGVAHNSDAPAPKRETLAQTLKRANSDVQTAHIITALDILYERVFDHPAATLRAMLGLTKGDNLRRVLFTNSRAAYRYFQAGEELIIQMMLQKIDEYGEGNVPLGTIQYYSNEVAKQIGLELAKQVEIMVTNYAKLDKITGEPLTPKDDADHPF